MKSIAFFFAFILLAIQLQAQAPEQYSRARIHLDQHSIFELAALGLALDHGVHRPGYIENDFSSREITLAENAGFRVEVLIEDVVAHYAAQEANDAKSLQNSACGNSNAWGISQQFPQNFSTGSMAGYFTYQEMLDQLDSMRAKYPQLISARTAINPSDLTHENRPIYWLRISDNPDQDENEPEALYNAIHHAREPMSMSQLIYFMWFLLENYSTDPNIQHLVNNTELYFVPCINPDGYIYNETTNPNGGGMWRKNRRNNGDGTYGVDLNRNYGFEWAHDNSGSSPTTGSDTYRGTAPFSEPETRNMRDFAQAHDFVMTLNYHSYGDMLIYPWAYNGIETADSLSYRAFSALMTTYNNYITGTGTSTVGYNTNGDADDWFHGEQIAKNKVLSMTPEAGDNSNGFWPASNLIEPFCKNLLWQNLSYAYLLLNYGQVKDQSAPIFTQLNNQISFEASKYGFAAGDLTVSIDPVSSNISAVGNSKTYSLNQLQSVLDSISLDLSPSIANGDLFRFALVMDNGAGLIFRDTVEKVFGAYQIAFNDAANTLNNWSNLGQNSNWELTTQTFQSAPSSITDSKTGNYSNSAQTEIILSQSIDLSQAVDASLNFWAKWAIEDNYDYVQVLAANSSGNFQPLCGLYTEDGTAFQDENQPVFDGEQSTWVQENMSLNDFLGESALTIKIMLKSDQWVRDDGFYFDDFQISFLEDNAASNALIRRFIPVLGQSFPNPADEQIYIPFELEETKDNWRLYIYNSIGQLMADLPIDDQLKGMNVSVGDWPKGNYFYQLKSASAQTKTLSFQLN